jgi:NADPH:quinone reductase
MKAITLIDFESGAALRELPTPEPGANEIRVRVHASSLNPFDFFVTNGLAKGMMEYEFPVTVGADFAGIVDKTGEDVSRYAVGDEVFGFVFTPPTLKVGTWAEHLVVPEDRFVAAKPSNASMLEVPIQSVHPLDEALDAFEEKAQGTHGKLAPTIVAQDGS